MINLKIWLKCKKRLYIYLLILVVLHFFGQIFFYGQHLDNTVINAFGSTDSPDYVSRAEIMFSDFPSAFSDGYRTPGYPFFLSLFISIFDEPLLYARLAQMLITSLMMVIVYYILYSFYYSKIYSLVGAFIVLLWPPLYHYSPVLLAETLSLFFLAIFIYLLLKLNTNNYKSIAIIAMSILSIVVYLKPNNIFYFIPFVLLSIYVLKENKLRLRFLTISIVFLMLLISPWSIFISFNIGTFTPLSTTQGVNMILGSGGVLETYEETRNTIYGKIGEKFNIYDDDDMTGYSNNTIAYIDWKTASQNDKYFQKLAIQRWLSAPIKISLFSLGKILHSFGFSLRGFNDFILMLFFIMSVLSSVYLWIVNKHRQWCLLFWGTIIAVSIQAFIFLPNIRFKTVFFDIPALITILLSVYEIIKNETLLSYEKAEKMLGLCLSVQTRMF